MSFVVVLITRMEMFFFFFLLFVLDLFHIQYSGCTLLEKKMKLCFIKDSVSVKKKKEFDNVVLFLRTFLFSTERFPAEETPPVLAIFTLMSTTHTHTGQKLNIKL